jgi:PIN domain nuclease of toxin-antitoxin system
MEMVLLERAGKIEVSYAELRRALAAKPGFRLEPLTADDVDEARALGALGDPFDRMIAGTALRLGLPLLSHDAQIAKRVPAVW